MSLQKQACADLLNRYDELSFDPENEDMLNVLFDMQLAFRKMLGGKMPNELTDIEKSALIRDHMEALTHECAELRELLAWKHWKKYPKDFKIDVAEARFEVADMMCFLMNIAILLGMHSGDFFKHTYCKQRHNVERQTNPTYGYIEKKPSEGKKAKKAKITKTKKR